jgi:hypothetical protein
LYAGNCVSGLYYELYLNYENSHLSPFRRLKRFKTEILFMHEERIIVQDIIFRNIYYNLKKHFSTLIIFYIFVALRTLNNDRQDQNADMPKWEV